MKPGIKFIIAGVALMVVGAVCVPGGIVLKLILSQSDTVQFRVPGSLEVAVGEPGRYYLWNDHQVFFEGKNYNQSIDLPHGIEISFFGPSGVALDFISDMGNSFSTGAAEKQSVGYVDVESPGLIHVEVAGEVEERILSFSRFSLKGMFGLFALGVAMAALFGVGGLILLVLGVVKTANSQKGSHTVKKRYEP